MRNLRGSSDYDSTGYVDDVLAAARKRRKAKTRRKAAVTLTLVLVLAAVLGIGAWGGCTLYNSANEVYADAQDVMTQVSNLQDGLEDFDVDTIRLSAQSIESISNEMQEHVDTPVWKIAANLPFIGHDVQNALDLVDILGDLSTDAIKPISDNTDAFRLSALVKDGGVDTDALEDLLDVANEAIPALQAATVSVNQLTPGSVERVNNAIDKAKTSLNSANDKISKYSGILPYLTDMLGAGGESRVYLLVAQNNAEIKRTGGYMGSAGVMTVTDGKIELGDFESLNDIEVDEDEALEITEEEESWFGEEYATTATLSCDNPDFPHSASHLATLWEKYTGEAVSGVVAVDPVFLQRLLALVGGVEVSGFTVDGDNAAEVLMHDVYWEISSYSMQDAFFAAVASSAFDELITNIGSVNIRTLWKTIQESAADRRLLLWMSDEGEQSALSELDMQGSISTAEETPTLGLYFNDYTYSKIDWYLSSTTTATLTSTNDDGSKTYYVTTQVLNTITDEEVAEASEYVTGRNQADKRSTGDMLTYIMIAAPAGGSVTYDSSEGWVTCVEKSLYGVNCLDVNTKAYPGETATVNYWVTTSPAATEGLSVQTTPFAQEDYMTLIIDEGQSQ